MLDIGITIVIWSITMEEKKPWYLSKTIVAGAVQIAAGAGIAAGYITPEDGRLVIETGPGVVTGLIAGLAGAASIYGRVTANKKIG